MPEKKKKKIVKKKAVKKSARKTKAIVKRKKVPKVKPPAKPKEALVGIITHYFPHVKAAVLKLKMPLSLGEKIRIKGHTTDFVQEVKSMQIEHVPISAGKKGDEIGLLVDSRVRRKDKVIKIS
ncbi:MAG: translation elongation factor-like protein [Candidatus Omnitrophica bacterium]|nr:translation elongation factor-like protein [Candidatus Omnitrophota bacterium]